MKKSNRRQFTTSTFFVEGQRCKIFFQPLSEFKKGFWIWNVGFAIGKSNRQLNDWYWKRKNKRSRSIRNKMVGKSGLKTIKKGFEEVLKLRWIVEPGDVIFLDCTSGDPERQFKAWSRWHRYHPEWTIDYEKKILTAMVANHYEQVSVASEHCYTASTITSTGHVNVQSNSKPGNATRGRISSAVTKAPRRGNNPSGGGGGY